MPDATLIELTKEVRWKTLKLLDKVDEKEAAFAPPGHSNTILWYAVHSLAVVDYLTFVATKLGRSQLPAGWWEQFGPWGKPAAVTTWPSLADVVSRLTEQRTAVLAFLETLTDEQLDRVIGDPPRNRTVRGVIVHGLHDEAGHQGEIHMLKKMWKIMTNEQETGMK